MARTHQGPAEQADDRAPLLGRSSLRLAALRGVCTVGALLVLAYAWWAGLRALLEPRLGGALAWWISPFAAGIGATAVPVAVVERACARRAASILASGAALLATSWVALIVAQANALYMIGSDWGAGGTAAESTARLLLEVAPERFLLINPLLLGALFALCSLARARSVGAAVLCAGGLAAAAALGVIARPQPFNAVDVALLPQALAIPLALALPLGVLAADAIAAPAAEAA